MLDECKGERFEEVLAIFSTAVLKRRLMSHGPNDSAHSLAYRLATAEALQPHEQHLIPPLLLSYRVGFSRILQERNHLKAQCDDFKDLLDLQKRKIRRREEQKKVSMADLEPASELCSKESATINHQLYTSWAGDPAWVDVIKNGQALGMDRVLQIPFDRVWDHVLRQTLFEIEEGSEKGLIDDLEQRIQQQRARLEKWKSFQSTFDTKGATATSTTHAKKLEKPGARFDLRFDEHLHLESARFRSNQDDADSEESPSKSIPSDDSRKDYMQLLDRLRDELHQAGELKRRNSNSRTVENQPQNSKYSRYGNTKGQSEQNIGDVQDSTPDLQHEDYKAPLHLRTKATKNASGQAVLKNSSNGNAEYVNRRAPGLLKTEQKLPRTGMLDYIGSNSSDTSLPGPTMAAIDHGHDSQGKSHSTSVERTRRSIKHLPSHDSLDGNGRLALPQDSSLMSLRDESNAISGHARLLEQTNLVETLPLYQPQTPPVQKHHLRNPFQSINSRLLGNQSFLKGTRKVLHPGRIYSIRRRIMPASLRADRKSKRVHVSRQNLQRWRLCLLLMRVGMNQTTIGKQRVLLWAG